MDKKQKPVSRYRTFIQACWFALTNGYIKGWVSGKIYTGGNKLYCVPGLNCYSCPGALGSCPIGSLQAILDSGTYKFSLYVFGMIAAFGAVCGRLICGWLCPFGLVQDLLYKIPAGKKRKNLPGHRYLKYLRYAVLLLLVIALPLATVSAAGAGTPWFCKYVCPSGTLLAGIPLIILDPALRETLGIRFLWKLAVLLAVIIASVKAYRPFCKYLCPLGALYGCANPVSLYRLRINTDACISCGKCQKACGMDIRVFEDPNSPDCIRCGACKAACPTGAITSTWEDLIRRHSIADPAPVPASELPPGSDPRKGRIGRISVGALTAAAGFIILIITGLAASLPLFNIRFDSAAEYLSGYEPMIVGALAAAVNCAAGLRLMQNASRPETFRSTLQLVVINQFAVLFLWVLSAVFFRNITMILYGLALILYNFITFILFAAVLVPRIRKAGAGSEPIHSEISEKEKEHE